MKSKTTLHVDGMSCSHCAKAVTEGLKKIPGVSAVAVDLPGKKVTITHSAEASAPEIWIETIQDLGYEIC